MAVIPKAGWTVGSPWESKGSVGSYWIRIYGDRLGNLFFFFSGKLPWRIPSQLSQSLTGSRHRWHSCSSTMDRRFSEGPGSSGGWGEFPGGRGPPVKGAMRRACTQHSPLPWLGYRLLLLCGSAIMPPPVKIFWLRGMGQGAPLGSHCTLCLPISSLFTSVCKLFVHLLVPHPDCTLCVRGGCTWHRVWHTVGIQTIIAESTKGQGI